MGDALLLQRSCVLELVLQLPLRASYIRSVLAFFFLVPRADIAADLRGVDRLAFHFELGLPFRPFEQLMGVLPEASKDLIPPAYRVSHHWSAAFISLQIGLVGSHV